jgi:hypothetical protein
MNSYVKSICEEYCKSVKIFGETKDSIEVIVEGQYFTELYGRLMSHGYCCISIMSNSHDDNHVATFAPAQIDFDMFDDFLGDGYEDDSSDWWKHKD